MTRTRKIITTVVALAAAVSLTAALYFTNDEEQQPEATIASKLHAMTVANGPQPSIGLYYVYDGDPTTGAGVCFAQWQLLFRTDNETLYYKSGTACTAWTPFSGAGGGTVTGTGAPPDISIWTGATSIGNYGGDTTCNSAGSAMQTLSAAGVATCVAVGSGDVTGTGSAHYYSQWTSPTNLTYSNILDTGSFQNTTRFMNSYNQFDVSVFSYNGDFTAGLEAPGIGSLVGSGRFVSYYPSASGGSNNFNAQLIDTTSQNTGTGGNLELWGNVATLPTFSPEPAVEIKASKTTAVASDDTYDAFIKTYSAGSEVSVCKAGHDGGLSLQTAGGYMQLIQATGSTATPKITAYAGNPNTHVSGTAGDFLVDTSTPALWQSTGSTAWTQAGSAGSVSGTANVVAKFTSSTAVGNSDETDDGTTFGAGANFLVTLSTGHFVGGSGGYVTGDVGFSSTAAAFTPGALVDIRTSSNQPLEVFRYNATSSGTNMAFGRGRGTIASPAALSLSDQILQMIIYGYDTNNAVNNNAILSTNVDQAPGVGIVPSNFQVQLEDASGTMRIRDRVDSGGHQVYPQITSPTATSCGTGSSVAGTDNAGTVTVGTAATGCTLSFALSWATPTPASTATCTVTSQTSIVFTYAVSNTAITIVSASASSDVFNWTCAGY